MWAHKIFWVGYHYINIEISEVSICYTILPSLDKSSEYIKFCPVYMRCVGFIGWKSFHKMHWVPGTNNEYKTKCYNLFHLHDFRHYRAGWVNKASKRISEMFCEKQGKQELRIQWPLKGVVISGWNPGRGRVHQVKLASVLGDLSWSPYCAANELCELKQARRSCVSLHRIISKARLCSQSLDHF